LETIAKSVGLSRFHFHRIFKKIIGVTPRQYAAAHRSNRLQKQLRSAPSITNAIYDSGYNSNSRFYENSPATLGMTPTQFRSGGQNIQIHYTVIDTPIGAALIAGTKRGICAILFAEDAKILTRELLQKFPNANIFEADKSLNKWARAVVDQIKKPHTPSNIPLDIQGTAFQQRVWQALREIPPGQTATYSEIAKRIKQPTAVRAVAGACAKNKIAFLIPCHRVIGADGSLTGFRWGIDKKRKLLEREK
jgi:AraC family transcriptional regulator, regulatory protein of adaptative response / methylated-DNA-[protein]-cysteine methyltransferase